MKKKKALGRGMSELVDGSFSSIVEPAAQASAREPATPAAPLPEGPAAPHSASIPVEEARPQAAPAPHRPAHPEPAAQGARPLEVISVTSGKGGTGKSILTSNLGILLAANGRVTILDADLGLANIHILYDLAPRWNASHVISGERTLEEIVITGPRGVRVIPGGSGIPELASLTDLMFGSLVSGMAALDGATDLLLIDTPSGLDRQSLLFLLASDQIAVVTTEDVTAMTDAYAVIKTVLAHRPGAAVSVVVNQATSYADGAGTFNRIAHVARKFLGRNLTLGGVVPWDELVERSVAERIPVALASPGSPAARAMASLAGRLVPAAARPVPSRPPFAARLKGLLAPAPR